ncbi:MAG: nucleotide exchange factor GrpE [Candidatus Thermoplasmatota archaeon]
MTSEEKQTEEEEREKQKKEDKEEKNPEKKIEELKQKNEELEKKLKQQKDKLLRTYAELDNYRKRTIKEIKSTKHQTKEKYLSEIIDLKELIQKAKEDKKPKEGLKQILKNIEKFLENEEVECIECLGQQFDHKKHYAVTTVEKEGCQDGKIIDEIKKGYKIKDKIIRPSNVIVAKNKEKKQKNNENETNKK